MADIKIGLDSSGVVSGTKAIDKSFDSIVKTVNKAIERIDTLQDTIDRQNSIFQKGASETKTFSQQLKELQNSVNANYKAAQILAKEEAILQREIDKSYQAELKRQKLSVASYFKTNTKALKETIAAEEKKKATTEALIAKENQLKASLINVDKGLKDVKSGLITAETFSMKYAKSLSTIRAASKETLVADDALVKKLQEVNAVTTQAANANSTLNSLFKTVKAAALGYATVLATMKLTEFAANTLKAGVEIDSLKRSFTAITGSASEAADQIAFLRGTADELGLTYSSLEKSYKDILAASKGTTLEGEGVQKIFTAIAKSAAVLGMSADDTEGSLRALSQMISKSNVQAEELRGQLGGKKLSLSINLLNCGKIFGKLINFLKKGLDYSSNMCYCN